MSENVMKIQDVMTKDPRTCTPDDRLHEAARVLWEQDCGCVPVVDAMRKVVGMLTDRDACMAVYTQGKRLDEIPVRAVMARVVASCRADEPVEQAMMLMAQRQIRRVPVVDGGGRLVGLLSTADVIQATARSVQPDAVQRLMGMLVGVTAPRSKAAAKVEDKPTTKPAAVASVTASVSRAVDVPVPVPQPPAAVAQAAAGVGAPAPMTSSAPKPMATSVRTVKVEPAPALDKKADKKAEKSGKKGKAGKK